MLNALRYYWTAARGYRLRPWQSPYIRWRLETYLGKQGVVAGAAEFFGILWRYRREFRKHLEWAGERRRAQSRRAG